MAGVNFEYSFLHRREESYTGLEFGDFELDLTDFAGSRAPSYRSRAYSGPSTYDDNVTLIGLDHTRSSEQQDKHDGHYQPTIYHPTTGQSKREKRRKLQGWRFGVATGLCTCSSVFLVNLVLTVWAALTFPLKGGIGTAYMGDCGRVSRTALYLHLLINALSSVLLSASNYTMQCLAAPTRKECDAAHAKGDWMDLGVASVRNLFKIYWVRRVFWIALAMSSVPIHLLYNSAVFKTLQANSYDYAVASPRFLEGGNFTYGTEYTWNSTVAQEDGYIVPFGDEQLYAVERMRSRYMDSPSTYANLTTEECIAAYRTGFVSEWIDVFVITNVPGVGRNNTLFDFGQTSGEVYQPLWLCGDLLTTTTCDFGRLQENAATWEQSGKQVAYCLAEITTPRCKLQFSISILIAVIACNAVKSICMFWTLWQQKDTTLVTIGDAISSYLDQPDETTKGRCLMSKKDVGRGPLRWRTSRQNRIPHTEPPAMVFHKPVHRRWFAAASVKRWVTTIGLCSVALVSAGALFGMGIKQEGSNFFNIAFGAVDVRAFIDLGTVHLLPTSRSLGNAVLLANLPQALLSFIYLAFNGLLTCLFLSHEWTKYAVQRKPLRVTTPYGNQRSTYYLQLPWKFGIPLVIASGTLHWLVSQSIFLARIAVVDDDTVDANGEATEISAVGFSLPPLICILVLGSLMTSAAVVLGFRKYKSNIPVVGSCSVAIASACHRPSDDVDAAYLPVQWGEVPTHDDVGHCCLTSHKTEELTIGRIYAGERPRVFVRRRRCSEM